MPYFVILSVVNHLFIFQDILFLNSFLKKECFKLSKEDFMELIKLVLPYCFGMSLR